MSSPNVSQLRNGVLAIVSLNPVASIAFLDAEISEAARMIVTGKYVAILSGLSVDMDGNSLTNMYFIGPGMPRDNRHYDEDKTMSIPISPARIHPLHRKPLQMQRPLPWTDCYVRTLLTERQARISSVTASTNNVASIILKDSYFKDLVGLCEADLRRTKPAEIIIPISDAESCSHEMEDEVDNGWLVELNTRPSKLQFTFDVWLDIGMLPELLDPGDLREELESLCILQDRDTRKHYAQYRRMKKRSDSRSPEKLGPRIEEETSGYVKAPKRTFRSWISSLFRKILKREKIVT